MSGEFLSLSNLNHLIGITSRFLYDKYNFRMSESIPSDELRKEWHSVMLEVHQNFTEQGMGKEFQKMNMKVLSMMKDRIKDRYQLQLSPEQAFTAALAQQTVVVPVVPVQGNPVEPEERIMDNALEENEFMDKVRVLENQRRVAPVTPIVTPPVAAAPPLKLEPAKPLESNYNPFNPSIIPTVQPAQQAMQPVQQIQPIQAPSQVLAPPKQVPKSERTHYIPIHAKDRNWQFSPLRHSWIWSGSLPTNANMGSLKLSAVMVPYWVILNTPFVMVDITGAGGQKMRSLCIFKDTLATKGWTTLIPLSRNDEMRPLATPWTITLLDAFEAPLALGEDSMIMTACDVVGPDQYRISLNEVPQSSKFNIGDTIEIGVNGIQATVSRDIYIANQNCYLFLSSSDNLSAMIGKPLLVKTAQPSLIFELIVRDE